MARTISEIYDSLNQVKGNMQELGVYVNNDQESIDTAKKLINDVRTASRVAIWRLWLWIMAVGSWVIENYQDIHEAKINQIITDRRPHQLPWYVNESKKFQYGHEIEWQDDHFTYAVLDEESRIVKYCSANKVVIYGGMKVMIKVQKAGKVPLGYDEIISFTNFWSKWGDAGVQIGIASIPINKIWFTISIWRDLNIITTDNTLILDPSINVLQRGAQEYLDGVEFDGLISWKKMIQSIINQPGIIDAVIDQFHINGAITSGQGYGVIPESGFAEIDWEACTLDYHDSYA